MFSYEFVRDFGIMGALALFSVAGAPQGTDAGVSLPAYTITDIGPLPGDDFCEAVSINNSGDVVGRSGKSYVFAPIDTHPWLYSHGKLIDLGLPPGFVEGSATSINDRGMIAGVLGRVGIDGRDSAGKWRNPSKETHPSLDLTSTPFVLWKGAWSLVPVPRTYAGLIMAGSNSRNEIAGCAQIDMGLNRPALVSGGKVRILPLPKGYRNGTAVAVNDRGTIAGCASMTADDPDGRAYVIRSGRVKFLGSIGGHDSQCYGMNGRDQIVGSAATGRSNHKGNPITHAFLWDPRGGMRDLGSLGGTYTEAMAVNDVSQVVGQSQLPSDGKEKASPSSMNDLEYLRPHAFLWQNGRMYDLNRSIPTSTGWILECATAINDHGVIVGFGTIGGNSHGFVLRPAKTIPTANRQSGR